MKVNGGILMSFIALVNLGGCEQPVPGGTPFGVAQNQQTPTPVMIETDAPRYPIGARVSIRLVNRTGQTVSCDLCRSTLEQLGDEGPWRVIGESLGEGCRSQPVTLRPGQATLTTFSAGPHVPAGQFRVHAKLLDSQGASLLEVMSNTFTLTPQDN